MSQDAFLVPITFPEFERTVITPVDITQLPIDNSKLDQISNPEQTRVWGVKNSTLNKRFYDKMSEGDYLLFYFEDEYEYFGRVENKLESSSISDEYWSGIEADMLYTITSFEEISLSRESLNQACEYKEAYQPQSIRRISNKAYLNIVRSYGSVEDLISNT